MEMKPIDVKWLLEYELQAAERYRRYLTLVLVDTDGCTSYLEKIFVATLRDCDAVSANHRSIFIIMSDTRPSGALCVIERLKRECDENKNNFYSVVSYPKDGVSAEMLIAKAQEQLHDAHTVSPGAIIYSD